MVIAHMPSYESQFADEMDGGQRGQLPLPVELDENVMHLGSVALKFARRGDARRADDVELAFIRRTQFGVKLADGDAVLGVPQRIVRAYGSSGRLAVEWCTMDGTKFTDIDGQEITHGTTQDFR